MTTLKALYYPFSRCLDENHLKRLLLVFDEIWFVDALSKHAQLQYGNVDLWFSRHPLALINAAASGPRYFKRDLNRDIAQQDWDRLRDSYKFLLSEGVINAYNPIEIVAKYDEVLSSSWLYDILFLDRQVFRSGHINFAGFGGVTGGAGASVTSWQTLRSRIPPSFFSILEPIDRLKLYDVYEDQVRVAAYASRDNLPYVDYRLSANIPRESGVFALMAKTFQRDIQKQINILWNLQRPFGKTVTRDYGAVFRTLDIEGENVVRMPFDWGASLCLNQALLIADLEGFALTTEQDVSHALLLTKYKIAARNHQRKQEQRVLVKESMEHSSKFASLAINVVNRLLPETALKDRTFQDIIKYRKSSEEARKRFLGKIHQLATEIETNVWDGDYQGSVEKILREIDIEAQSYSDSLTEVYEELFSGSSLIKQVGVAIGPSLLGTLLNLSPGEILLLACSGLGSAIATVLPDFLQAWQKKRKVKRNYIAYLVGFPKKG